MSPRDGRTTSRAACSGRTRHEARGCLVSSRFGHYRKVVIVGHDILTANRSRVLVVPVSDVASPDIFVPAVADEDGEALGVAQVPYVGEVAKATLTKRADELTPASIWSVDIALRAALDL